SERPARRRRAAGTESRNDLGSLSSPPFVTAANHRSFLVRFQLRQELLEILTPAQRVEVLVLFHVGRVLEAFGDGFLQERHRFVGTLLGKRRRVNGPKFVAARIGGARATGFAG